LGEKTLEVFFFWVAFSVAVAILASNRGRSGFGWFLFSLLLSPLLGLIFVLVLRNLKTSTAFVSTADRTMICKCPECREEIRKDARRCKHCGASITPELEGNITYSETAKVLAKTVVSDSAGFDTYKKLLAEVKLELRQSGLLRPQYQVSNSGGTVTLLSEKDFNEWVRLRVAERVLEGTYIEVVL
jgi:hypothetical protein